MLCEAATKINSSHKGSTVKRIIFPKVKEIVRCQRMQDLEVQKLEVWLVLPNLVFQYNWKETDLVNRGEKICYQMRY